MPDENHCRYRETNGRSEVHQNSTPTVRSSVISAFLSKHWSNRSFSLQRDKNNVKSIECVWPRSDFDRDARGRVSVARSSSIFSEL